MLGLWLVCEARRSRLGPGGCELLLRSGLLEDAQRRAVLLIYLAESLILMVVIAFEMLMLGLKGSVWSSIV